MTEYFTLPELRALPDMSDAVRYPDARVEIEAVYVVAGIERAVGTSFIARTITDEVHDGGVEGIALDQRFATSLTSAKLFGSAVTDTLRLYRGCAYRFAGNWPVPWTAGYQNVKLTYSAGYSTTPPGDIKSAALQWTRARLLTQDSRAGVDDRRTSVNTELGVITYAVADEDHPSGYPEVDSVICGWRDRLDIGGFA